MDTKSLKNYKKMKNYILKDRVSKNIAIESLFVKPHAWDQSNKELEKLDGLQLISYAVPILKCVPIVFPPYSPRQSWRNHVPDIWRMHTHVISPDVPNIYWMLTHPITNFSSNKQSPSPKPKCIPKDLKTKLQS